MKKKCQTTREKREREKKHHPIFLECVKDRLMLNAANEIDYRII